MKPENVNPTNFKVKYIIYKDEDFSIAYGKWHEDKNGNRLGMRWNGKRKKNVGNPAAHGKPLWFMITLDLTNIFLVALLNSPSSDAKAILDILGK